ncbi:MAG: hypothetical protein LUG16_04140 [Candidatus Gastranaerophilales bacterium]|nr:hypothetical protein [Candidatus Gastranaerophilales bacterium]
MEQVLNDNIYVIDLGEINTAPEIIFELSSVLDKDEAKNRRICLKLGSVDLNQAQLLSIKSLINGIESTLSTIDTKSVATEKVAMSLGIIISNVSVENSSEIAPAMPYKTAEEFKEEKAAEEICENNNVNNEELNSIQNTSQVETEMAESFDIVEESENIEQNQNAESDKQIDDEIVEEPENITNADSDIKEVNNREEIAENQNPDVIPNKEEVQDELDVIFGSDPVKSSIFEQAAPEEIYEEKEELADIIVPEAEYTKEDIELETYPTKYIKQTIRSGQVINYEGNIVIIGDCHPGCEITAFGDITVWGVLSGIAHSGAGGNQKARVRALKMNAIQLRIANCYSRRPDSLNTVFIEKTNSFTPEEARIINGEIVVFKIND